MAIIFAVYFGIIFLTQVSEFLRQYCGSPNGLKGFYWAFLSTTGSETKPSRKVCRGSIFSVFPQIIFTLTERLLEPPAAPSIYHFFRPKPEPQFFFFPGSSISLCHLHPVQIVTCLLRFLSSLMRGQRKQLLQQQDLALRPTFSPFPFPSEDPTKGRWEHAACIFMTFQSLKASFPSLTRLA